MNMTVPFRALRVTKHPREAEINCLPTPISLSQVKRYDPAIPTMDAEPVKKERPSKTIHIAPPPKSVGPTKAERIIATDLSRYTTPELAVMFNTTQWYMTRIVNTAFAAGKISAKPKPAERTERPDSFYLAIAQEADDGSSYTDLMNKHGLTKPQVSYCVRNGRALRG